MTEPSKRVNMWARCWPIRGSPGSLARRLGVGRILREKENWEEPSPRNETRGILSGLVIYENGGTPHWGLTKSMGDVW